MKITKLVLLSLALCFGIIIWLISTTEDTTTSTFCAYGRVFVRVKDGNTVWGTILLDDSGVPVKCKEDDVEIKSSSPIKGFV